MTSLKDRQLSRDDVEDMIARGQHVVVWHDRVLRLDSWLEFHPGGYKVVEHMVGRDATQEIEVHHSDETLLKAQNYIIGKIELPWDNFRPPVQGGFFRTKAQMAITDEEEQKTIELVSPHRLQKNHKVSLYEFYRLPREADDSLDVEFESVTERIIEQYDRNLLKKDRESFPPCDHQTQDAIVERFNQLHKLVQEKGLFQCNYWGYFREFCRISTLLVVSYYTFQKHWLFVSAVCLGLAWHQMTFIAHDAGHQAITHWYQVDNLIGTIVADFCGGLSLGWWKRNHNVHHIITNDPVHDPDIQHLPFFAVSTRLFGDVFSTYYERFLAFDIVAKYMIRVQNYTYYLILCFGRFNLYRLSLEYVLLGQGPRKGRSAWFRYLELVGLGFFIYWFFYLVVACSIHSAGERWMYVMVSHIVTMPVHVQITLSHFAMSTSDLGLDESFPQRQLRTTMDVDCPAWFDYVHGGLQFQAIHHLFPRMPRHNFRKAQPYVIDFCKDVGLEYTIYGFHKGNMHVIDKLAEIAHQASILADCTGHLQQESFEFMVGKAADVNKSLQDAVISQKRHQFDIEMSNRVRL
ncbi:uncharacterized protein SAPINGB_P000149 [Magnusiomyces paraingens]|uniref:Delta 8-(E)-sphingolipid desaturase n=1 Tax=Magnusiomyces paraingens TaxID=2606893 RepID=A0A5E8AYN0_9ASCO|nr:uncharacterized protein SAPINGB_P000149 [Saprochaete ingens]VVT43794.1 unnamed protein product [Saprochaete ingens]